MSRRALPTDERLLDLLTSEATEGLDARDRSEFEALLRSHPDIDADSLAEAAAAFELATLEIGRHEALPAPLRGSIAADANRFLAERQGLQLRFGGGRGVGAPVPAERAAPRDESAPHAARRGEGAQVLSWIAAAAAVAFAMLVGWPDAQRPAPLTITDVRAAPDVIVAAWAPPEAEAYRGVTGEVVWSSALQRGFMRLRGMPVNDPSATQYQLWIVDPARDQHPVDGGVFDIPAAQSEVVVPIDAKLAIGAPSVFAITREQPGGVVVSGGPLLVVAPVEG